MVNVNQVHVVTKDKETAKAWISGLRSITNNIKMNNACPKTNLKKHWTRILLTTTVDDKVSVKAIAKTFASGKTEKLVYETLAEVGLPCEKVRCTKKQRHDPDPIPSLERRYGQGRLDVREVLQDLSDNLPAHGH